TNKITNGRTIVIKKRQIEYTTEGTSFPNMNSLLTSDLSILWIIKSAIINAPNGSKILLTKESVASNTINPKIEKYSKTLEESADGIATTNKIMPKISDVDSRDLLLFFVNAATITSYKLNEDVNVANKNKIKNNLKNKLPKGICPKATGNTINNKLGP